MFAPINRKRHSRSAIVRSATVAAIAGLVFVAPTSTFACGASAGQFVRLQNQSSGFYLAVSGGHVKEGADVIQWADEGQRDVHWVIERADGGAFRVRNAASGLYLAVSGGRTNQSANVIQWPNVGQPDVKWRFTSAPGGDCKLLNVNSGLYLAVSGGRTNQGASAIQWADVGQGDIVWQLR